MIALRKVPRDVVEAVRREARAEGKSLDEITEVLYRAYLETNAADRDTSDGGHQPPSGLRGDPGAPRTVNAEARDDSSVSSADLTALVEQWKKTGANLDAVHATMGTGYKQCADQLAALLTRGGQQ